MKQTIGQWLGSKLEDRVLVQLGRWGAYIKMSLVKDAALEIDNLVQRGRLGEVPNDLEKLAIETVISLAGFKTLIDAMLAYEQETRDEPVEITKPGDGQSMLKAWTDYPIQQLGDQIGEQAPIREIVPIKYDGDKYVKVLVEGHLIEIKSGYIFTMPGRLGEVPVLNPDIINQRRWAHDCSCGTEKGGACRQINCQQLKDRFK